MKAIVGAQRNSADFSQPVAERGHVGRKLRLFFTSQTDVQEVSLPKAPGVAAQVVTEIELGNLGLDLTLCGFVGRHFEFDLLRQDDNMFIQRFRNVSGHRAKMSAGAHDQRRADLVIDDPLILLATQGLERLSQLQPGARALQQVMIELAAPDAVAHDMAVPRRDLRAADQSREETGDRLQRPFATVVIQIDLELVDDD